MAAAAGAAAAGGLDARRTSQLLRDFERDGFVVVPDAVSSASLSELRRAMAVGERTQPPAVPHGWLARHPDAEHHCGIVPVEHGMAGAGPHGAASRRYPHIMHWMGQLFLEALVDNAAVRPMLSAALGEDFVLDHDYAHVLDGQLGRPVVRGSLHSVPHCAPRGDSLLWDGTCDLVTCVYDLCDAPASDGVGCNLYFLLCQTHYLP
eukprot:SAG31_NODE_5672_length_2391_cov_1.483857_3_plen_206_part_00